MKVAHDLLTMPSYTCLVMHNPQFLTKTLQSLAILGAMALGCLSPAQVDAYLHVKGRQQGAINGSCTLPGRVNTVPVIRGIRSSLFPIDFQGGGYYPDVAVKYKAVRSQPPAEMIISKDDISVPHLQSAMNSGEMLTIAADLWANVAGTNKVVGTINYKSASVTSIDDTVLGGKVMLRVKVTYHGVEWRYSNGAKTETDAWTAS